MKTFIAVLISVLSFSSYASFADHIFERYGELYEKLGQDNNYLDRYVFQSTDIEKDLAHHFPDVILVKNFDLQETLERCVFNPDGAYGEHLSRREQAALVEKLTGELQFYQSKLTVHRVDNIYFEYLTHECALLIIDKHSGEAQIIQGVGMD